MQVSYLPNHLLSCKEGPSFHIWGASLFYRGVFLLHISFLFLITSLHYEFKCKDRFICFSIFCSIFFCEQVVKLYERCVIACANYPEYWIRYILCMQASDSMDLANNALARASQVFVKVGNRCICLFHHLWLLLELSWLRMTQSWSYVANDLFSLLPIPCMQA